MNKIAKLSAKGISLLKQFEGFRSKPYLDDAGVPTIGYGSTYYESNQKVRLTDPEISEPQASVLLQNVLVHFERGVDSIIRDDLTQNQFDALVCFVYNIGLGGLQRKEQGTGKNIQTTICKKVNANPNDPTIRQEFLRWNKAGGKVMDGLTKRRTAEANLYFS